MIRPFFFSGTYCLRCQNIDGVETRERGDTMELKVFKDTLSAAGTLCDAKAELPVETEILIPDYLPQIFKIVKCFVHLVGLQKQITGTRLVLDGYLRCVVFYQGEGDQSLCQTEQKIPFTKAIDLAAGEYTGYHVYVSGDIEYLNCRAVNQRRIDVRGAYALTASVSARVEQEIVSTLAGAGAELKNEVLPGTQCVADMDKLISAEEEVIFPQQPCAVLDISGTGTVQDIRVISGKAVVKGEIEAQILYRTEAGYHTEKLRKAIPFNQIIDLDGVTEECRCFAAVEPIGCTLMAGSAQENSSVITVTALLHLRVFRSIEYCAVADAFSTQYETELTYQQAAVEQLEDLVDEVAEARISGALPDENAEIIQCFASPAPIEMAVNENQKTILRGRATAHVFCMNSLGEIDCYDKPFEYVLPGEYDALPENLRVECWPAVQDASGLKNGGNLSAQIQIHVTGTVLSRRKVTVLESIQCLEELDSDDGDVALRICYAAAGENVFDIAKKYHVSPKATLACNALEELQLENDTRLLIPMNV